MGEPRSGSFGWALIGGHPRVGPGANRRGPRSPLGAVYMLLLSDHKVNVQPGAPLADLHARSKTTYPASAVKKLVVYTLSAGFYAS